MIKAVFFDYDGVLTRDKTGSLTTNRFISKQTGIPYASVRDAFQPHNDALNEGKTNYAAIWPSVCGALGREIPRDVLVAAFESTPINEEVLRLARQLRARCSVGIVTDNKADRMTHLRRHQRLDALFSPIVVSAEVGVTKATTALFEYALACVAVRAEDSLFIDNSEENLVAPAALGMRTIHFDDERNDVAGLARLVKDMVTGG